MPYSARTDALPELAFSGGLVDPRASHQFSFGQRMACRDVTEFIFNEAESSLLGSKEKKAGASHKPAGEYQAKLDKILARSKEIGLPTAGKNGGGVGDKPANRPVSDLVQGLVISGGLSRSPAFDCLPVVSHWMDRTGEPSSEDPNAAAHGIGPVEAGSSKFSQQYLAETDTLVTSINLARRLDTPQTGGVLGVAASVSWMRNTRVADAVDCAVGLLSDATALLAARNKAVTTGTTQHLPFAEVRCAVMPTWCLARKPLPPKLSGVALSPDPTSADLFAAEQCEGPLLNTSIFSMALGYNRGVYGGSISGLWSIMDSAFVLDYSVGVHSTAMADSLSSAFAEVAAVAEASVSAGPHITDIRIVKGCNYGCLRQKTIIEDTNTVTSRPCMVVWDDLARLSRYKVADAVFCHVYYDSGGGEQMAAIAGLGCVAHDWIDLGADVACGEVSNIIPSLTRGSLDEGPLAEVYSRLVGALIWYRDNDPYNPAALCILFTHWWQLANCRHRPIALMGRTDLGIDAAIAGTIPAERPTLEHFRVCGTKVERGERPLASAEARLQSVLASNPLPETRAVIELLVEPVLAYMKGADSLPSESEYVGAVLTAELAYPHGQKIMELWDLAIIMWECGSMWAAGIAGLCYTHTGNSNCDRARDDLSEATWT
ncbi:hypothetical protein PT974_05347 [Cladobotryum mycophilum]|uniref:Uncharacterized protein n=1 Tax=Cladobotryum mycophilum TaxID=491253 RepID=A0ABR0SJC1_9HYPO